MSFFLENKTPRPYIVIFEGSDKSRHDVHVNAYDLGEALMQASMQLSARGIKDVQIVELGPDDAKLKELAELNRMAMTKALHAIGKRHA